jgi:hypothetical protein
MDCRHSAGNLHINIFGAFNGMCAWELFKILKRHDGARRVFINTANIVRIAEEGVKLFKSHMTQRQMPKDWLYKKGKKGFAVAPDGSRVLICKKAALAAEDKSKMLKQPFRIVRKKMRVK